VPQKRDQAFHVGRNQCRVGLGHLGKDLDAIAKQLAVGKGQTGSDLVQEFGLGQGLSGDLLV
jgi:hypothetical protein